MGRERPRVGVCGSHDQTICGVPMKTGGKLVERDYHAYVDRHDREDPGIHARHGCGAARSCQRLEILLADHGRPGRRQKLVPERAQPFPRSLSATSAGG